jgi:hypothetical protein
LNVKSVGCLKQEKIEVTSFKLVLFILPNDACIH